MKSYLVTAAVAIVAVAIVFRIPALKSVVTGT
jgi:hypothetical protein